jgi:Outer membrane protein beta-barrel domain
MPYITPANRIMALACALVLAGLAAPAQALDGHFFLRGETGQGDSDFDFTSAIDDSDNDQVHAVRAGYYFHPNFAVEAFHGKLYDERVIEIQFDLFTLDAEVNATGIGVIGKKRFGDERGFFVQGRGGFARYEGSTTTTFNPCAGLRACPSVTRTDDSATKPYLGIGAGYDFNDRIGVGVNYDLYKADLGDIDIETRALTAAVEIRF